jgi:bifunctional non-homologous end joining protein LigD
VDTSRQVVEIAGRRLILTHLDKVLYPETGTRKADVIGYYALIAPLLIAHAHDRPVTRVRWVHGVGTTEHPLHPFVQKDLDSGTPDWVPRVVLRHHESAKAYPLVDDAAVLAWFAQIGALEVHTPQWRVDASGERMPPDRLVLDLDPGDGVGLPECAQVALWCRAILTGMGLDARPVMSGSKGIHLYCGLDGSLDSEQVAAVAHELARALETDHRDLVVSTQRRIDRAGKVLVDWSQNSGDKTTVAPYSLRGRRQPWVAAPRTWEEIEAPGLRQLGYEEVLQRVDESGDLLGRRSGPARFDSVRSLGERSESRAAAARSRATALAVTAPAPEHAPTYAPMLASPGTAAMLALDPGRWVFEGKWDGIRALASVTADDHGGLTVRLTARSGNDITATYPELAAIARAVDRPAVLDGEVVAFAEGRTDFGLLQRRHRLSTPAEIERMAAEIPVRYLAFDVLEIDGRPILDEEYDVRRAALSHIVTPSSGAPVDVPPTVAGTVHEALERSARAGWEGIVAKDRRSTYSPGRRSTGWVKLKHRRTQEVVVGGWMPGDGRRAGGVGSLLVGIREAGALHYAGRVGTGFSDAALDDAAERLAACASVGSPFDDAPAEETRGARWVRAELVGEVEFAHWTRDGRLRHASWRGWRDDKRPDEATRDAPWLEGGCDAPSAHDALPQSASAVPDDASIAPLARARTMDSQSEPS